MKPLSAISAFFDAPLGRYTKRVGLWLAPLLIVGWFASGFILDGLRPVVSLLGGLLQLTDSISAGSAHGWIADPGLTRASGSQIGPVQIPVPADDLRRMLLSFPIFLALTAAAPPKRLVLKLLVGCLALIVVFGFSACALIFNSVTVIVNHRASLVADNVPPPDFTVTHAPFSEAVFFLAGLALYLAMQFVPLGAPIAAWAAIKRDEILTLSRPS